MKDNTLVHFIVAEPGGGAARRRRRWLGARVLAVVSLLRRVGVAVWGLGRVQRLREVSSGMGLDLQFLNEPGTSTRCVASSPLQKSISTPTNS